MDDRYFDLLIVFRNGDCVIIKNVESYGTTSTDNRLFYYTKNGSRSFMPIDAVSFIGRYHDYINYEERIS